MEGLIQAQPEIGTICATSQQAAELMAELPSTIDLMDNKVFKKAFGAAKGKLKGFCPDCMYARSTKWDTDGHATAYQTSKTGAHCAMCEKDMDLSVDDAGCASCGGNTWVQIGDDIRNSFRSGWRLQSPRGIELDGAADRKIRVKLQLRRMIGDYIRSHSEKPVDRAFSSRLLLR